ncbi:transposase [Rhizobium tumorigenes]|uniref:transposase n=1 Tax=Rhizobium tumorigenes TaxID=2041385 RepID=UPI003C7AA3E9
MRFRKKSVKPHLLTASTASVIKPLPHTEGCISHPTLYKKRHKIENMFGRLKDWRRIHTRYDRCAHTFFSSICIEAAFIFWL